jgi:hypothetical protein
MPVYENLPIKVTLTVEIDGHVLKFEESETAKGARYGGKSPRDTGYASDHTLESSIRDIVVDSAATVGIRATQFINHAYPVCNRAQRDS